MATGLDEDTISEELAVYSPASEVIRALGGAPRICDPDDGPTEERAPPARIGKYELLQKLAQGAIGVVFEARDTELDRIVALKILHPDHSAKQAIVRRFLQEAHALSRISHPGVVRVLDSGHVDDFAYIAMDLVDGESLLELISAHDRMLPNDAVEIARQLAAALEAAHAAGVLHRDLTTENVVLVPDPSLPGGHRAVILDFGLAKLFEAPRKTAMHVVFGTPHYMSPEQCLSSTNVDHRTDIYALGCILFELVTGTPPYNGEIDQIIEAHLEADIPRVSLLVHCSAQLDDLITSLLAKNPEQRPPSMTAVRAALDALPHKRLGSHPTMQVVPPAGGLRLPPMKKPVPPPRTVARGTDPPPAPRVDPLAPTPPSGEFVVAPRPKTPSSVRRIDPTSPNFPETAAFPGMDPTPPVLSSVTPPAQPTPVAVPPMIPRSNPHEIVDGRSAPSGPLSVSTAMAMSMAIAPMPKARAVHQVMAVPVLPMPRRNVPEIDLEPDSKLPIILIAIACILAGAITAMFVA